MQPCRPTPIAWFVPLLLAATTAAHAGQFTQDRWSSTTCGSLPAAPAVNGTNDTTYNASVTAANAYLPQLRDHLDCVIKEANADVQRVSQGAQATQQAAAAAREKLLADLKSAEAQLK